MLDRPAMEGSTFLINGKAVPVHPSFRLFITRNPGYRGTNLMNEALRDRFWSIDVPPLLGDGLREMFRAHDVPPGDIEAAAVVVEALYSAWERNRISYQISPRRAIQAADISRQLQGIPFEELLTRSVMTKVDQKHDRDSVEAVIREAFRAAKLIARK
jgi:nitric oxide reductase NorQ protein